MNLKANSTDSLLNLIEKNSNKTQQLINYLQLTENDKISDSSKLVYFNHSIRISKKIKNDSTTHYAYKQKFNYLYADQGLFYESLKVAESMKELIDGDLNYLQKINIYRSLANPSQHLGNYDEAKRYYLEAIRLANENGDIEQKASISVSIGRIYAFAGLVDEAIIMYQEILKDSSKIEKRTLGGTYVTMGNLYDMKGEMDKAKSYWKKSIELYKNIKDEDGYVRLANSYLNLAYYFHLEDSYDIDSAMYYTQKSYQIQIRTNNKYNIGSNLIQLADIHLLKGNIDTSENYLFKAEKLFKEVGSNQRLAEIYKGLTKIKENKGIHKEALKYSRLQLENYTKHVNQDIIKQTAQLEKEFEFDKERETSNFILKSEKIKSRFYFMLALVMLLLLGMSLWAFLNNQKKKQLISVQNDLLRIGLEEKEILLKEVHHRVKNNLQVMSGLLQLQSNTSNNEELKKVLHQSRNRIYSIAIIHELLYQDKEIREINAEDYFKQIIDLNSSIQKFKAEIIVNADNLVLDMDQAIPLGLIINELTLNSYKHGFNEMNNSKISINFSKTDELHTLIYSDNGKGLEQNLEIENTKSLGLRLVRMMIKQLKATVNIESKNGFTCTIKF